MQYGQPWERWLDSNLFVTLPSHEAHGAPRHRQEMRPAGLPMQVVFVQLVVDAAGGDPEQLGRMRLIAVRPVQSGLEH